MKRSIAIIMALLICAFVMVGCEYQHSTGNRITAGSDIQTFNYAYVYLDGNKIAEGAVMQWRDYEDSDTIQVMMNGKFYLTHYSNVVLVADPEAGSLQYSHSWNDYN